MTSKTRATLRSAAMTMDVLAHVGKNGVTDAVISQIDEVLEARELVKVRVLKNSDFTARDIAEEIAVSTRSEIVQTLGGVITLYRFSYKENVRHVLDM